MFSDWISRVAPSPQTGPIDVIKDRPWSMVAKVPTADGTLWFKENRAGTRFEAGLLCALARWAPDDVITPIAVDAARGWSLLPDGGAPLRDLDPRPDAAHWERMLAGHADLQRRLAGRVLDMLAFGVPDHRPHAIMAQFDRLPVPAAVAKLRPRWSDLCDELAASPIPASLQHDDLHDGNVFASGRFFDWGDANVGHPFSVLLVAMRVAAQRLDAVALDRIRDAYLDVWSDLATGEELRRHAYVATEVGKIGRALAWNRALATEADRAEYGDSVTGWLEMLLEPAAQ